MRLHTRGKGLRLSHRHLSQHAGHCTSYGSGGIKRRRLVQMLGTSWRKLVVYLTGLRRRVDAIAPAELHLLLLLRWHNVSRNLLCCGGPYRLLRLVVVLLLAFRASALLTVERALFSTLPPPFTHGPVPSIRSFSTSSMVANLMAAAIIQDRFFMCMEFETRLHLFYSPLQLLTPPSLPADERSNFYQASSFVGIRRPRVSAITYF